MRLVKIENCSYIKYSKIRDAIFETIPYSLFNQGYSPGLQLGIFNFWDLTYIPEDLIQFIVQPPVSRENVELLHKKISEALL